MDIIILARRLHAHSIGALAVASMMVSWKAGQLGQIRPPGQELAGSLPKVMGASVPGVDNTESSYYQLPLN